MQKLEEIAANENSERKSIDNLLAGVGNGHRNETTISIGWPAIDILRVDDPQQRIETRSVGDCYVIFGINPYGDVILGHYTPTVPREMALELARVLIEQQNLQHPRKLDFNTFQFKFVPGPNNPTNPNKKHQIKYSHYNVYYDRNQGLHVEKFPEPLIEAKKSFQSDKYVYSLSKISNVSYLKPLKNLS